MFDGIPIAAATYLKSESEPRQHSFEMMIIIDQNRYLGDRHVLLQFSQKQHGKSRPSGLKEPSVGVSCLGAAAAHSHQRPSFTWITVSLVRT